MTTSRVGYKLLKAYFFFSCIIISVSFLRSIGVYNIALFSRFMLPALFLYGFFSLLLLRKQITFRSDRFSLALLGMMVFSVLVGFFRGNDPALIVTDAAAIFIAWFLYIIALSEGYSDGLLKILHFSAGFILFAEFLSIVFHYFYFFHSRIYLSFGDILAIVPFVYYHVTNNKKRFILSGLLIFLGAKVGVIFSALIIFFMIFCQKRKIKLSGKNLVFISIFVLMLITLLLYLGKDSDVYRDAVFGRVLNKIQRYNIYRADLEQLEDFGAGRASEVIYSLKKFFNLDFQPLFLGAGSGFEYDQVYRGSFFEKTHNVHFSPICLFEKLGLPLTFCFYFFWLKTLNRFLKLIDLQEEREISIEIMGYVCLGIFIFSFTAYAVFVVSLHWFFLGYINFRYKQKLEYQRSLLLSKKETEPLTT